MVLWAVGDILNYFWGSNSFTFVMFSCVAFFGTAFVNSLNWALVPDTVDYGEWKTGIRAEGSVYTGYTFFRKISAALAGFLPGIMLTQIGYVPTSRKRCDITGFASAHFYLALCTGNYCCIDDGILLHTQ